MWPEVTAAIKKAGINDLEIYQVHSRLFMIMETDESFSFERKWRIDASDAKVQEWEKLMWQYQQALPAANPAKNGLYKQASPETFETNE